MNTKRKIVAASLLALFGWWLGGSQADPAIAHTASATGPVKLQKSVAYSPFVVDHHRTTHQVATKQQVGRENGAEPNNVKVPLDKDAVASFAASVLMNDPRAPPIAHSKPREPVPREVLEDPEKYLEYEAQQRRQTLERFVSAAKTKLKTLNRLIAQGKEKGISPEKLAEGIGKVKALQEGIELVERELR